MGRPKFGRCLGGGQQSKAFQPLGTQYSGVDFDDLELKGMQRLFFRLSVHGDLGHTHANTMAFGASSIENITRVMEGCSELTGGLPVLAMWVAA
jgi:hypothetical protein